MKPPLAATILSPRSVPHVAHILRLTAQVIHRQSAYFAARRAAGARWGKR